MKKQTTKRALLLSALSLVICVAMLVGTTFAWFTDSVTSGRNQIVAGNLDVELEYWDGDSFEKVDSTTKIFNDNALWEPGYTEVAYLKVSNLGSLALKYQLNVNVFGEVIGKTKGGADIKLSDHLVFAVNEIDEATVGTYTRDTAMAAAGTEKGLKAYNGDSKPLDPKDGTNDEDFVALIIYMPTTVGNEANHNGTDVPSIEMGVNLLATQYTAEEDSFGSDYDSNATYPAIFADTAKGGDDLKAGDVTIALPDNAPEGNYLLEVENTSVTTDENGNSVANFDITLTKDGAPVSDAFDYEVTVKVATGINPNTVKVLHKGVEITNPVVDPVAGTVTFTTNSFSPYQIIYTVDCDMFYESETNTYNVFSADGMMEVYNKFKEGKAGKAATIKLHANIDMTGKVWETVDSHVDSKSYLATLDGQGFTISNLTINGQAMFRRFAGSGDVVIKDVTFYGANVNSNGKINTSILTVQSYQNVLLDNVDVKNSSITGGYKVAPLIATVYNESSSTITATLKNCDVYNTTVKATAFDFCTTGMVAFVYAGDNDKIEFSNCTVTDVKLYAPNDSYKAHTAIYTTGSESLYNEADGVTVTNVTFEAID